MNLIIHYIPHIRYAATLRYVLDNGTDYILYSLAILYDVRVCGLQIAAN